MRLELGNISVDVVLKDIRNVHLSVHPPLGKVRIAAPKRMAVDTIRLFAISKLSWIKKQQSIIRAQERETPREYVGRESHYVWGKRYLLSLCESNAPPSIELKHNRLLLRTRPGSDEYKRLQVVEEWYRAQVRTATEELIAKWESRIGVNVCGFYVQRMKTRWGSCNPTAQTNRPNHPPKHRPGQETSRVP